MERNMYNENRFENSHGAIGEQEMKKFIERRGILQGDLPIIEELAGFPNDLITQLVHNVFNSNHEKSGEVLESIISTTEDADYRKVYQLFLDLLHKYDWPTCYNLVRILEDRNNMTPPLMMWEMNRKKKG